MWCALHLLRWKVLYGPCLYNFAQSFVSNYKISFSAKIIKGFRSKGNFAVFIAVQTNFYLIQSDKMPSFLLHTPHLSDTGQKTGSGHFNLPDSDQNMFSQTEKVELLKTNNEKSFNSNLIFLPTSAGTTQSAPRTRLGSGFRVTSRRRSSELGMLISPKIYQERTLNIIPNQLTSLPLYNVHVNVNDNCV